LESLLSQFSFAQKLPTIEKNNGLRCFILSRCWDEMVLWPEINQLDAELPRDILAGELS
jgi:hypothetical protein